MTNYEYILSGLDDRRLAELFNDGWRGSDYKSKVWDAFNKWTDSLPYHQGNIYNPQSGLDGLDPNPFVFNKVFVRSSDNYQSFGRSFCVAFQDWLLSQYDPTQWE